MYGSMFRALFAGVPSDIPDTVPLISFGRWLLTVGVFLLTVGFSAEKNSGIEILSGYRYGTALNWWKKRFVKGLVSGIQKAAILPVIVFAWDLVLGRAAFLLKEETIFISALWLFHVISLDALLLLLDFVFTKRFIPAVLLLLEGVTFIVGCQVKEIANIMYGMWGMYLRSDWYETGGFPAGAVLGIEFFLVAGGYFAGRGYLKKWGTVGERGEKREVV